ncbi:MAG: four helix bundle protein [Sphingobacteriales bacterium]|uniref:four helix bundle protein n=1 Tax=Hydrotalea flava TaxID=714549 RepID=UPI000A426F1D|nr:four helix bundle protein [Hydrotalea flava]RTL54361.1 MAG: four helix bundle protein [Sphingobacteriales bacterium]
MSDKKHVLKDKSFAFALRCISLYKHLNENKKEFVISKQLLRSGTSVGANIREAQNAESKADFIHKLAIAQKECDETIYWLELLYESEFIINSEFEALNNEANQILKMLRSSILTTKQKSHYS